METLLYIVLLGCVALITTGLVWFNARFVRLNHYQLKRQASATTSTNSVKMLYSLHMRQTEVLFVTQLLSALLSVLFVLILSDWTNSFSALILSFITFFLCWFVVPFLIPDGWFGTMSEKFVPVLSKVVTFLAPVSRRFARVYEKRQRQTHQYLYTREQLLDVLGQDKLKGDSDVTADELRILRSTLTYGDTLVREIMTPRRMVKTVSVTDQVGPILMHELHETGFSRFPVTVDDKSTVFVGTLYLRDLVDIPDGRSVKDVMKKDVFYMHEEQRLDYALRAFLKTKHHLFVVVNSFEEFVGVLTLEDIVEQVLGREIVDEFDNHEDLRSVARSLADKEIKEREEHEKQHTTDEQK